MFAGKPLIRKIIGASLFISLGLGALGMGQVPKASAAEAQVIKLSAIAQDENPGDEVVSAGSKFLGVKYRFGAPSGGTSAFDCSSFTQYIFKQFGITLPRTSSEQSAKGLKINKKDLAVGDLVFFKDPGRDQSIGHVAIYAGDHKILHASSKGGVKFTNLDTPYYTKHYVTSRRVL